MEKIFKDVSFLDKRCYSEFSLSEEILMENAASGLEGVIPKEKSVLIVAGAGNNGADGITLARRIHKRNRVYLYLPLGVKSNMAKLQLERAKKVGVEIVNEIKEAEVVVDAIFGSGLKRDLSKDVIEIIEKLNKMDALKIACDIPTGIDLDGNLRPIAFKADITITMGALKEALFSDNSKDFVGEVVVADLGVSREVYEIETDIFKLTWNELNLPIRKKLSTHKGNYGTLGVVAGEFEGAAILASKAAFNFGAGLINLIGAKRFYEEFIITNEPLKKINALVVGPGLGGKFSALEYLSLNIPKVIDADCFYFSEIKNYLKNAILTPHPKEFSALLSYFGKNISVSEVVANKIKLAREFSKEFKDIVLVLKGANTVIAKEGKVYINSYANPALSKGGMGDILAGLIGALLANGFSLLEAAISGSLALTKLAFIYDGNNFSFTPKKAIELIKRL